MQTQHVQTEVTQRLNTRLSLRLSPSLHRILNSPLIFPYLTFVQTKTNPLCQWSDLPSAWDKSQVFVTVPSIQVR